MTDYKTNLYAYHSYYVFSPFSFHFFPFGHDCYCYFYLLIKEEKRGGKKLQVAEFQLELRKFMFSS